MQNDTFPTGTSFGRVVAVVKATGRDDIVFNEIPVNPSIDEADIVSQYWTAAADRALAYEAACRSEYETLAATIHAGTILDNDQRMQVKQIEAVLGIPPEMSILGTPAA